MRKSYTKILVARFSPKNKCFASDGDVLYAKPRPNVPQKSHVSHHFVSSTDEKKSQYGWVAEVTPFSMDTFISERVGGEVDEETTHHIQTMLEAIAGLTPGTPVAADYSQRGVEKRRMEFSVHRVFFYKE